MSVWLILVEFGSGLAWLLMLMVSLPSNGRNVRWGDRSVRSSTFFSFERTLVLFCLRRALRKKCVFGETVRYGLERPYITVGGP
jgi:hypothetical protein